MLFDQEYVRIQENFRRLASAALLGLSGQSARLDTDEGVLELSAYAPGILRLRLEKAVLPDYGLLAAVPETVVTAFEQLPEFYRFSDGSISLELSTRPLRIRLTSAGRTLLESSTDRTIQGELRFSPFAYKEGEWLVSLALQSGEPVYGLGEKFGALDRRGQLITSWNRDATGVNAELSYKNTPFAWSPSGWGVFVNTPTRVTHAVGYAPWSHRSYILKIEEPNLDLFLFSGENPAEIIAKYTWLTGRASIPPRWSYGTWMSRAYYKTADELLEVAHKLRERRIPCDVITLDGRAWHKPETRFDFSWDADRYPDPPAFIRKLDALNLRLCLWEYPYISTLSPIFPELEQKGYFLKNPDGSTYVHRWFPAAYDSVVPHLKPSGIIDFTNPEAYQWYLEAHRPLHEIGNVVMKPDYGEAVPEDVVAFNGDRGTRLHNVYAFLYNRCVFEASQKYSDGVVWSRAGWTGSQRYPVQWGGDPQGDWEGLAASIRGGLSWGLSGAPFYSHDVGGFFGKEASGYEIGGGSPEAELYVRWAQACILCSHTRFHGTSPREPWEFGDDVEGIIRKWLDFRYQLIPYLQSCALEASRTGLPVMRPMVLAFPEDRLARAFDLQYMLGGSLLVVPVLKPGGVVSFYLPAGRWFDLWDESWLEGPRLLDWEMPLDRIPVFGREGTLLPLGPAVQHTAELKPGLDLEKVLAFGKPQRGIQLPGLELKLSPVGQILNLPEGVRVEQKLNPMGFLEPSGLIEK